MHPPRVSGVKASGKGCREREESRASRAGEAQREEWPCKLGRQRGPKKASEASPKQGRRAPAQWMRSQKETACSFEMGAGSSERVLRERRNPKPSQLLPAARREYDAVWVCPGPSKRPSQCLGRLCVDIRAHETPEDVHLEVQISETALQMLEMNVY